MTGSPRERAAVGIFSRGMARAAHIEAFLDHPVVLNPRTGDPRIVCTAGWGRKASEGRARRYAAEHGIPCWTVEDGFLRSVGLGVCGAAAWSLIVDDVGIYFDGTAPSRLEQLLNGGDFPPEAQRRAAALHTTLLEHNLAKFNHAPDARPDCLPDSGRLRVLLVDQTANDQSIRYGLAGAQSFRLMLEAARAENPSADLIIKTHPDVVAGRKSSALGFARDRRDVIWVGADVSPLSLLRQVDRVYTVSSQMGFEALLLEKPVACFGLPFYAGWGLTDDRVACPRRVGRRSLLDVLAAAYILYPRYVDPVTGVRCEVECVVERLALQRRRFAETAGRIDAIGFSFWKRGYVRPFVSSPWNSVRFVRRVARENTSGEARVLVWASRETAEIRETAKAVGMPVWRMEDGFIRSLGLGSDFVRPWSLVLDQRGIYFDPAGWSDLEWLLNTADFPAGLLRRAARLRELIRIHAITKYNVESDEALRLDAGGRTVVLVPGQVENDASVVRGSAAVRTNVELLKAVRASLPEAYLLFKPHPDVVARNRPGSGLMETWRGLCDRIETRHSIVRCIEAADEIHTMTSLAGFDALLRDKRVVTYGLPFYAGWGLTVDRAEMARRRRTLSVDQLVAGSLLLYPRYWDPEARCFVEAEDVVRKLIERKSSSACRRAAGATGGWRKWLTYARALGLSLGL